MKRAIVLQVRESENKRNNNEKTVWVTLGLLPSKMKNGNLYYPKTSDVCISTCAGQLTKPDGYSAFKSLAIGSIVGIGYGVNEITGNSFISTLDVLIDSPFTSEDLFD